MTYYISRMLHDVDFEEAIRRVIAALESEGFGVLTEIDVRATLKKKLDVDFQPYRILGACNPAMAHKALTLEDKIGTMLPCNVIVKEDSQGRVEIAAVDPVASMQAVENENLGEIATEVRERLKRAVDASST
jgi:uncharacterized protein (DUF302 family)